MLELLTSPVAMALLCFVGGFLLGCAVVLEVVFRRRTSEVRELREALDVTYRDFAREANRVGERDAGIAEHVERRARLLSRMALTREALDERTAALNDAETRLDRLHAALARVQTVRTTCATPEDFASLA